jgi:hypothetical protein
VDDFYWNIDWVKRNSLLTNSAYFHAQYRQATPHDGWFKGNFYGNDFSEARKDPRWFNKSWENNYVILETSGDGQFAGVMMSIFNNQWGGWNEGDEMIWIDGEKEPRIHGTGGEDYFNAAWGYSKLYATPQVGLVEFTGEQPGGRYIMYRWHLEAPRGVKKLEQLNPQEFKEMDEGLMKDLCRAPLWPNELETNARICHRFD